MSTRKLNALERKLHQAALAKAGKIVTPKELEDIALDASACLAAVNFLLGTGLLVLLKSEGGQITYRAVTQEELNVKKGLDHDEGLVLDRIRAAGREGIWTKHIKAKTQLHQTVVDRCLKSLTKRRLVKTVPDVRYPSRKIYMLESLQPAPELTGGPWYTDKELDTEFIKLLSDVCLKIVQDRSLPRASRAHDAKHKPLYPLSQATYTTSQQVLAFLRKSRVTETALTVEHVETLLNVLVLDGKIEKIPAFRPSSWNVHDSDEGSGDEEFSTTSPVRKRKRGQSSEGSGDDQQSNESKSRRSAGRSKPKRPKIELSDDSSDSPEGSLDGSPLLGFDTARDSQDAQYEGGAVYRAIREERILSTGTGQAPCVLCPRRDFCSPQGLVSPQGCVYYDRWLAIAPAIDGQA